MRLWNGLYQFGVEELDRPSQSRDLNHPPPSNICGMNWNADRDPDLIKLTLSWLDGSRSAHGGKTFTEEPRLSWRQVKACAFRMTRSNTLCCPQTFVHVVAQCWGKKWTFWPPLVVNSAACSPSFVSLSSPDAPPDNLHLLVLPTQPSSYFNDFPPDCFLPPGVCREVEGLPTQMTGGARQSRCLTILARPLITHSPLHPVLAPPQQHGHRAGNILPPYRHDNTSNRQTRRKRGARSAGLEPAAVVNFHDDYE